MLLCNLVFHLFSNAFVTSLLQSPAKLCKTYNHQTYWSTQLGNWPESIWPTGLENYQNATRMTEWAIVISNQIPPIANLQSNDQSNPTYEWHPDQLNKQTHHQFFHPKPKLKQWTWWPNNPEVTQIVTEAIHTNERSRSINQANPSPILHHRTKIKINKQDHQ